MLLVTVRVSVQREEVTGRCVNSGSKCRRSVGPDWEMDVNEHEKIIILGMTDQHLPFIIITIRGDHMVK